MQNDMSKLMKCIEEQSQNVAAATNESNKKEELKIKVDESNSISKVIEKNVLSGINSDVLLQVESEEEMQNSKDLKSEIVLLMQTVKDLKLQSEAKCEEIHALKSSLRSLKYNTDIEVRQLKET